MFDAKDIENLIAEYGGTLVRNRKHRVWKFPDGRIFVIASSPSDVRAEKNNIAGLYRFLGVEREINKNPDRRPKKGVQGQRHPSTASEVKLRDWKSELKKVRLVVKQRLAAKEVSRG